MFIALKIINNVGYKREKCYKNKFKELVHTFETLKDLSPLIFFSKNHVDHQLIVVH